MAKTLTTTSIAVTINGNDYSKHVMFPFKVSNLLDEQLDEASLTFIGVPEKNFKPLTDVIVTLTNDNKTQKYSMLVASDKADEIPTGSGRYKHELYLIEQTKYLECFISRSIGFVNQLERSYTEIEVIPSGEIRSTAKGDLFGAGINTVCRTYTSPLKTGDLVVYGLKNIINAYGPWDDDGAWDWKGTIRYLDGTPSSDRVPLPGEYPFIAIIKDEKEIYRVSATFIQVINYGDDDYPAWTWEFNLTPLNSDIIIKNPANGLYRIIYRNCNLQYGAGDSVHEITYATLNALYFISVVRPLN